MTSTPNVTRDTFVPSKMYLYGTWEQGKLLHDWDINEKEKMKVWFDANARNDFIGSGVLVSIDTTDESFYPTVQGPAAANVDIQGGSAIVGGLYVQSEVSDFPYYEESLTATNYILKGTLSTVTTVVAGSSYKVTDAEKLLTAQYGIPGCRIYIGGSVNAAFDIASLDGQQIVVSGDISAAVAGDDYIILPPQIVQATASETFHLVAWLEGTSGVEDSDLIDPFSGIAPSHRSELRWCIYWDYASNSTGTVIGNGGVTNPSFPSGEFVNPLSTHYAVQVFQLDLSAVDGIVSTISSVDRPYFKKLRDVSSQSDSNASSITTLEAVYQQTLGAQKALEAQDFKLGSEVGSTVGVYFSNDNDGTDTTVDISAGRATTKYLKGKSTEPYNLDIPAVAADVPGDTATGSGYYKIDVASTLDGVEGNIGSNSMRYVASSSAIDDEDFALMALRVDGSKNIVRMMPMGYQVYKQGLDWTLYLDGTFKLEMQPGTLSFGGNIYQLPHEYTIANCKAAGAHVGGSAPTSSWSYMYVFLTAGTERSLRVQFDVTKPKWNGEHPSSVGYCVGMVYFDGSSDPLVSFRRGDTVYLGTGYLLTVFSETGSAGYTAFDEDPPVGCTSFTLQVESLVAASERMIALIRATPAVGAQLVSELRCTNDWTMQMVLPGTYGTYEYNITNDDVAGTSVGRLLSFTITEGYFPDTANWTD